MTNGDLIEWRIASQSQQRNIATAACSAIIDQRNGCGDFHFFEEAILAQITTVYAYDIEDTTKSATIILNGKNYSWTTSNNSLFETDNGKYNESGTVQLINSGTKKRVAQFRSFSHFEGMTGNGLNDELGSDLNWVVKEVQQSNAGGGTVGCFPADTEILMSDGSYTPISKLKQGDLLLTANSQQEVFINEVAHVFESLHESLIELKLSSGASLKVSATQPILSVSGPVSAGGLFDDAQLLTASKDRKLSPSLRLKGQETVRLESAQKLYSIDTREDGFFFVGKDAIGAKCKGFGGPYGPPPDYRPL